MTGGKRLMVTVALVAALLENGGIGAPVLDELGKRASWESPTASAVKQRLDSWLADRQVDEVLRFKVETLWSAELDLLPSSEVLERLAISVALVESSAQPLIDLCSGERISPSAPDFAVLADETLPEFIRDNLRLLYGRWLAQHDLYDETLVQLSNLNPEDVVDPASLLFYQGVAYHRLLQKEGCLPVLERLLENEDAIPQRYATLARLMVADIRPLRPDTLDEIARLMNDIRRRQRLYRSGTHVRRQEEDVLAKLDKLIKELEQQQQQQTGAASGTPSDSKRSTSPLQDSIPAGGKGEGNVDPKDIGRGDNWGDLPPKERQAALQDLSKDLPAHYREVIEEYFRKLARDDPR